MASKINKTGAKINSLLDNMESLEPKVSKENDGFMTAADKNKLDNLPEDAYRLPEGGIPEEDLSDEVKAKLAKAEDAYRLPEGGIPEEDMSDGVKDKLAKAELISVQALSGYVGFSPQNDPADISSSELVRVEGQGAYVLTNVTDEYYLWILSEDHMQMYAHGVQVPMYYIGMKDGLHVYRSEAMGVCSFFATFGVGNANEPVDVVPILYTLSYSMQHITASGPQSIMSTDQATIFLTADTGYTLPDEVTVTNASVIAYDSTIGTLVIGNATGNVTVEAVGVVEMFSVTNNLSSVTNSNDATTAAYGSAYNATLTPASGYEITALSVTMGGVPVEVSGNIIDIASVTGDIVITAVAETAGKVTVNVTSGGVAVEGALVTITIDNEEYTGTTNGSGQVLIVSAVGNGSIKVEKEGYVTYTGTIAVGTGSQTNNISISEIPTYTISGECNVDGVTLHIGSREVVVANGTYSVSGVLVGTYNISCEGYSATPSSVTVVDADVVLDITLAELTTLSGTVVTELGSAVAGATVLLQAGGESESTTTSSTGEYSFDNVPQGEATLTVTTATGTVSESITLVSGANTKDIETRVAMPDGYTRYDWAHFTSSQNAGINNFTVTQNTKIEVKFVHEDGLAGSNHIFGTFNNSSSPQFHMRMYVANGVLSVCRGEAEDQTEIIASVGEIVDDITHIASVGPDGIYLDGVRMGDAPGGEFSYTRLMGLGSLYVNSYQQWWQGKIYWFKIYENGVLSRYYVPCTKNTGAKRLYDIVNKVEISGNGAYTVGND